MAPQLWLWLHVATAMVAVSFPYHHERHPHIRRSHTEHQHFLGNFLLNDTSGKDSRMGLGRPAEYISPYEAIAQPTPSGRSTRRHQRHRHRRRLHSHRVPDIIYSFGNHSAAKLYRGKGYRVGPYTGYVDVWTIPRQSRLQPMQLPHRVTPSPSPPPSPPQHQRQQEHYSEGTAFARVLIAPEPSNTVTPAEPWTCLRCPKDRTVWVGPGFTCAEVPKPRLRPCSRLTSLPGEVHMTATMGPEPGSLVMEGVYQISFTLKAPGMASQNCHYKLRVRVRRCPALQRPQHGGARCSQGRHWGSRCRFFCKQGYALEQRVATRCAIHDGARITWTPHPAPVCRARDASAPDVVTNSVVPSTATPIWPATEASAPTTKKELPASRSTRPPKPKKQLACRWPKAPLHGWVWCDRGASRKARVVAREGTRCRQGCRWAPLNVVTHFSCVAGAWQGRKAMGCTAPPETPPTERPRTTEERAPQGCEPPAMAPGGRWSCPDGGPLVAPGAECAFVCDQDYEPVAENPAQLARRCLGDRWNHTAVPVCKKSGCDTPSPVPNSALQCSADINALGRRPVDTICRHVCDKGYEVLPSQLPLAQVTCLANGKWDQEDQPQCVESGCDTPSPVPNSALECSAGVNALGRRPVDTICRHVCEKGYEVLPSQLPLAQVTCLANGKWDHENQPQCVESGCASLSILPDTVRNCSNHANHLGNWPTGTVCKITCRGGFAVPENQQSFNEIFCQKDGSWSQTPQLECHKRGCTSPDLAPGSSLECSESANHLGRYRIGTLCKIVCDVGLGLLPDMQALNQFVCQDDGTWNQTTALECTTLGCESPNPVPDSSLECSADADQFGKFPTGTVCKVTCADGLALSSSLQSFNQFVCQEDGTWNHTTQLECRNHGCPMPNPVPDSSLECSLDADRFEKFPAGTICKVVCAAGLALPSNLESLNQFVCQEDGTWNQTAQLECRNSGCPGPNPVPASSLNCSADADRFGKRPVGTTCQVVCADGHELPLSLRSLDHFVCQEDGTWNQTAHLECRTSGCTSPAPVPDATVQCTNGEYLGKWPVGTTCSVVCAEGLSLPPSLRSSNSFVCLGDGTWNQSAHFECRESGCAQPEPVPDSSLECSSDANHLGNRPVDTLCEILCNEGFALPSSLQSSSRFVCREDGTWNQTAQLQCLKSGCANLSPAPNSALECSNEANKLGNVPAGTVCEVVCSSGFALPSEQLSLKEFLCQEDGNWNHEAQLECNRVTCDSPSNIANSVLECSNGTSENGKWSVGTLCRYACNEGYAVPKIQQGLNSFICREDGTWSSTDQLTCEETGCESPKQVQDSVLNCTAEANSLGRRPAGTICSYDCNEGYGLAKSQIPFSHFVCQDDGTWNHTEELRCQKTGCEDPSAIQFSMVNCSGAVNTFGRWPVGTECSHICEEGYAVSRHEAHLNLFICLDGGTWNQTEGIHCRETGCEEPGQVPHASINCSSDVNVLGKRPVGTVCSYVCSEGFAVPQDLELHNQFVCSDDGSWDQKEELLCLKTGCESPRVVQNSVLHCSQSANVVGNWPVGTTCQHVCDNGFVIPQSQLNLNDITCLDDGKWNETDDLQCVKLRDPQLSQGCKDDVVVVDGRNVSFPVVLEVPTFEAFNGTNAAVNCTNTQVETYGTHIIICDAVDSELQSTSSCTYNVTALATGCAPLQSDPYSRVSCSADRNVTEGQLHPVGDVCEYICQQHGYVIPQSKVDWAVKECLPNGSWTNDDFNLCHKQLAPVLVSGCNDTQIGIKEQRNVTVPLPVYHTGSGQLINATCTPDILPDFADYDIKCTAEDDELRSSASCTFKVKVHPTLVDQITIV